jgi:tetratricopeptide (TPR) repeat protein
MLKRLRSLLRPGRPDEPEAGEPRVEPVAGPEQDGAIQPAREAQCDPRAASADNGEAGDPTVCAEPCAGAPAVDALAGQLLRDSRVENRRAAAEALGRLGAAASAAIPCLLRSVAARDATVRDASLHALEAIDPGWRVHEAVPAAMMCWAELLRQGDAQVNRDLERQVILIGAPAAPGLARALAEAGDVSGNWFVLQALGRLGPAAAPAVPAIAHLLTSQYSQVCIAAAEMLERIGPPAAPAIPALKACLTHWNSDVRRAVARCLARIDPGPVSTYSTEPQASPAVASPACPETPADIGDTLARLAKLTYLSDAADRVALCQQALAQVSREADPVLWAKLHNELAKSLAQDPRGDQANNIESAIQHFEQALTVLSRQDYPEEWAVIQNNLASAFRQRSRGERADNIELAIACCENALAVRTRQADPEGWATSHNNLGNIYRDRIRGDRAANIELAIQHCALALEALTPHTHPWKWATAQSNLANVYLDRIGGDRVGSCDRAIHHYEEALKVFTRTAYPHDWAWTQSNLGVAYRKRAGDDRPEDVEQAIDHLQQALEVYTRRSIPVEWAATHLNLGNAYRVRMRGQPAANLAEASRNYRQALEVFTSQTHPEYWAMIQSQLAGIDATRFREPVHVGASSLSQPPPLTYPQFYEEEARRQPGAQRVLTLVFAKPPESKYEISLLLVYQWEADISEPEAQRLAQRAIAYISCAIHDAARRVGLSCRASPIPNGRRPAWLIANESMPVSLTLSDIDLSDRTCQMSIGPVAVALGGLPIDMALLARLLEGFKAGFGTISV